MICPIKYRIYNNRLWVRSGLNEEWAVAKIMLNKGKKLNPIIQGFGEDFIYTFENPLWKGKWFYKEVLGIAGHNGIDFCAPTGTRLYAPHDGVISELMNSDGIAFRLKGKEYTSIFYHLQEWHCSLGQEVKQGDFLALTDNTGRYTTGPHLHWGMRPNNPDMNNGYNGYIDFKGFIEKTDVDALPYEDGTLLQRTGNKGQVYLVDKGELVFLDSEKGLDRHIPLVDWVLKASKTGLPKGFLKPIDEQTFNIFKDLIN